MDELQLKRIALRGLTDLWYLGSVILRLGLDEPQGPRPRREIEPVYRYVGKERPPYIDPEMKWMRSLCIPRYLGKTFILLVKVFQTILRNPDANIGYHCNEKDQAIEGVRLVRDWFELPQIVTLYGSHKSANWSAMHGFVSAKRTKGTRKDPTLRPLGLDKPLEGKRVDLMVWDDLIGLNNYTPDGVIRVEQRLAACRPLIRPGGEGLYVCTRWGLNDPMADGKTFGGNDGILRKWRTEGSWDCFGKRGFVGAYAVDGDEELFPYILDPDHPRDSQGRRLLFPSVYTEKRIQEEREGMPFGLFASQILNDPLPAEAQVFLEQDVCQGHFDLYPLDPEEQGFEKRNRILDGGTYVLAIDPNKQGNRVLGGDKVAFVVLCIKWVGNQPFGFVVEWFGGRWKTDQTIGKTFEMVQKWRPSKIYIETNVGGTWIVDPIRKRGKELGFSYLPIVEVKQSKIQKEPRIVQSLQPAFAYHQIFIARHLHQGEGEDQTVRYTEDGSGMDDFVDVLAMGWEQGTAKRVGPRALERQFQGMPNDVPNMSRVEAAQKGLTVARTWRRRRRGLRRW